MFWLALILTFSPRRRNSSATSLESSRLLLQSPSFGLRFKRRVRFGERRTTILPLHGGEGRGEGERCTPIANSHRRAGKPSPAFPSGTSGGNRDVRRGGSWAHRKVDKSATRLWRCYRRCA